MFLTDYHMHSLCSMDGNHPLQWLAEHAISAGFSEICLTDHCDMLDMDGNPANFYNWKPVYHQLEQARAATEGKLTIKMGLEFGSGFVAPKYAEQILAAEGLDFVIGSAHNMSVKAGGRDNYFEDYSSPEKAKILIEDYLDCLLDIAKSPFYDVIGHVIYLLRYVPKEPGYPTDFAPWWDRVQAILRTAVEQGKGIEVNTYCGRTIEEWRPILEEFKRQGGEVLTFGSDAHHAENVGKGIQEAYGLAIACGFQAGCIYTGRRPTFFDLKG